MIRWKSLKSSLLFGGICFTLLLLNKSFVEEYEKQEKNPYLNDDVGSTRSGVRTSSGCDPAVLDELDRLRKGGGKARCSANNGKEMACMRDENEYYFPFSFIKKQYDVTGRMSKGELYILYT